MSPEKNTNKSPMGVLFLVVLIDMIGLTLVIPFLTYFVQDLALADGISGIGARDLWVGIIIAAYSAAQFIFTPILGSLSDRWGRRPILMFGLASNTIFFTVFGLSGSLTMALIARFLAGAGNGNIAVAKAYIGDISSTEETASRMGAIGAAFGLGFMIGPFIGGVLADPASTFGGMFDTHFWRNYPYLLPCLFCSLLSLTSLSIAARRLPESLAIEDRTGPAESAISSFSKMMTNSVKVLRIPIISTLVIINFLYMVGFSMMHGTFILFTAMEVGSGGLGFSELQNGLVFAFIGLLGVIVQGMLIGRLTKKFKMSKMMVVGIIASGLGIASLPYVPSGTAWLIYLSAGLIAIGNGLYSPTQSSVLTFAAKSSDEDLGMVMGAQEGFGALARIIGPLSAAYIWSRTVESGGMWTYHTCFRVAGVFFVAAALLQFSLKFTSGPTLNSAPA